MRTTRIQFALVTLAALGIFLPFLAVQYDVNGVAEALAVESGQLFHKNHMLYRMMGYGLYQALHTVGSSSRAIVVLQVINAVCGALGVGFAYITYKRVSQNTWAALLGALMLGGSFVYWLFSTDVAYITVAAMFAGASMALLISSNSRALTLVSGVLTALSILTWQASVFLIPALSLLAFKIDDGIPTQKRWRKAAEYAATAGICSGLAYTAAAFTQQGAMSVSSLARWFTSYGESGTLPMWGRWDTSRMLLAARSALWSILPTPLAVPLSQISWSTQRGRIAVDIALVAVALLSLLAAARARGKALWFLSGYLCFLPFIVWWDPFDSKWFVIPNLFLAAFFSCAWAPWFQKRGVATFIFASVLFIAATNFVTTIRPRHNNLGAERLTAQCVGANMEAKDLLLAPEWGWPDYLEYLHGRQSLSLISHFSSLDQVLAEVRRTGGKVYIPDPKVYSQNHLAWLQSQSGIRPEDLSHLSGAPAFSCNGRTILSVPN